MTGYAISNCLGIGGAVKAAKEEDDRMNEWLDHNAVSRAAPGSFPGLLNTLDKGGSGGLGPNSPEDNN